ncbi:MAG: serine hydrolase domain-containing protein [Terriglobia bacterium]
MNLVSPRGIGVCAALLVFALSSLAFADTLTDKVDAVFADWDQPDSPGCALGVVQNGKLIYTRGYGMASLEHRVPISSQSVFYIGSTSKQFVAASVVLAAAQRQLSLDDDIRKHLPEMPDYGTPITLRHLIHHSSGLRDYLSLMSLAGMPFENIYTDEELIELLARQKQLNFTPGEQYLYSNSGYFLLAQIVKRATGHSLRAFAEENIFKPLGMTSTHFHDDRTLVVANRATAYSPQKEGGFRLNWFLNFDKVGSGGLLTTVEDLYLWDQNFYEIKVGGRDFVQQLLTPGTLNNGQILDYAFGLAVGEYKGLKTVSHGGAFMGFRAQLLRFPEQKFSVICLCNLSNINPTRLARQVADIYLADLFTEEPAAKVKEVKFVALPEQELKDKVGAYRHPVSGNIVRLSVKKGKLLASAGGLSFQLAPLSPTHFRSVDAPVDVTIRFERPSPQDPWRIQVDTGGRKPDTYEAIQVVSPTPAQLKDYVGAYYSEELQATYRVVLKEGQLMLRRRHAAEAPLRPTLRDQFQVGTRGMHVEFVRREPKRVSGFRLHAGRVRNLRFVRKTP